MTDWDINPPTHRGTLKSSDDDYINSNDRRRRKQSIALVGFLQISSRSGSIHTAIAYIRKLVEKKVQGKELLLMLIWLSYFLLQNSLTCPINLSTL
ncbi:hypothetical protein QQP08_004120 [Theobroma cacao]|nr:hypothetical protein QQP08_004120 [Theobroma cacao]